MKRYSKKWFSQIMIHKQLKQELDELKEIVRINTNVNHRISYVDVIRSLISEYKNSLRVEYPINQKTQVGTTIKKKFKAVVSLKRINTNGRVKMDDKTRA